MKKTTRQIKHISILLIFFSFVYLSYSTIIGITEKKLIAEKIQKIPEFNFQGLWGYNFNSSYINKNNSCLIIYFHPDCEHCQYEAEQLSLNIDQFSSHQILMISPASHEKIEKFVDTYHLLEFDNITILVDTLHIFQTLFGKSPFPTSFIYDQNGKLIIQFKGEVTLNAWLKYLNQEHES